MWSDDARPSKEFPVGTDQLEASLKDRRTLFALEGGSVSTGTFGGQCCLVTNENYFDDGDAVTSVRLFSDDQHRERYIVDRGWSETRAGWRVRRLEELRSRVEATYREGGIELAERDDLLALLCTFEVAADA